MTAGPVVAIDFGTSYSSAAVVIGGRIVLVKEPVTHGWSFPSAVCRTDGGLLTGTAARNARRAWREGYRDELKRDFGQDAPADLDGVAYPVEDLVAAVLAAIRQEAERTVNQPVRAAVLTVPVSYGPRQRTLMRSTAAKAGFTGPVTLLDEPYAAACAPAHGPEIRDGELLLVYDFGGGTFDAALLRAAGAGFELAGKSGLDPCGGADIDRLLYDRLVADADRSVRELLSPVPGADPASRQAVAVRQENLLEFLRIHVKHQLSSAQTARDTIDLGPLSMAVELDEGEFRALTGPLVGDTVACCAGLLRDASRDAADIAAILLAGGSTRMPAVADTLTAAFGRPLRRVEDPEVAVALGAAYWAYDHPSAGLPLARAIAVPRGPTALGVTFGAPDGVPLAVTGGMDGWLRLWNLADGGAGPAVRAHDGAVTTADLSADGSLIVSGGRDGSVRLWRPGNGETQLLPGHADWVNTVRISPDGGCLLSVSDDGEWACLRLPADSGTAAESMARGRLAGARAVRGALSAATPGLCAIADSAGAICLSDGRLLSAKDGGRITALALDAQDRWVAAGYADGTVRTWELAAAEPDSLLTAPTPRPAAVVDLRFGPAGVLASGHEDGTVAVSAPGSGWGPAIAGRHEGRVRAVAVPAEDLVLSAGSDGHVRSWLAGPPRPRPALGGHDHAKGVQQ